MSAKIVLFCYLNKQMRRKTTQLHNDNHIRKPLEEPKKALWPLNNTKLLFPFIPTHTTYYHFESNAGSK